MMVGKVERVEAKDDIIAINFSVPDVLENLDEYPIAFPLTTSNIPEIGDEIMIYQPNEMYPFYYYQTVVNSDSGEVLEFRIGQNAIGLRLSNDSQYDPSDPSTWKCDIYMIQKNSSYEESKARDRELKLTNDGLTYEDKSENKGTTSFKNGDYKIELTSDGTVNIVGNNNSSIRVNGSGIVISNSNVTIEKSCDITGDATITGTTKSNTFTCGNVITSAPGFCLLPKCVITGAPHVTNTIKGQSQP